MGLGAPACKTRPRGKKYVYRVSVGRQPIGGIVLRANQGRRQREFGKPHRHKVKKENPGDPVGARGSLNGSLPEKRANSHIRVLGASKFGGDPGRLCLFSPGRPSFADMPCDQVSNKGGVFYRISIVKESLTLKSTGGEQWVDWFYLSLLFLGFLTGSSLTRGFLLCGCDLRCRAYTLH